MLSALDIPTTPIDLPGVYDGEWKGSGEVFQSVCPATGEVLANVKSVSCNICLACCSSSSTMLVAARVLRLLYCTATTTSHRHHRQSSMAHWRGRGKHTYISEVYLRPREVR